MAKLIGKPTWKNLYYYSKRELKKTWKAYGTYIECSIPECTLVSRFCNTVSEPTFGHEPKQASHDGHATCSGFAFPVVLEVGHGRIKWLPVVSLKIWMGHELPSTGKRYMTLIEKYVLARAVARRILYSASTIRGGPRYLQRSRGKQRMEALLRSCQ